MADTDIEHITFVEQHALASVALTLADAIEASNLSYEDVAHVAGTSTTVIDRIMTADLAPLSVTLLARLFDACGCRLMITGVRQ